MIGYLQGTILEVRSTNCLLLTPGGVGYTVQAAAPVLERLPEPGQELSLYVHTVVREDALELYGFPTRAEQETFSQLIAVSKLGPKTALAILSVFDPQKLGDVVQMENVQSLTRVPGIGPKSAKRIIWELKDKLQPLPSELQGPSTEIPAGQSVFADALAGLLQLGYSDTEVRPILSEIMNNEPELMTGEAIRAVLKRMAGTGNN
jgi:Holliday junction DNA helicase RuvA